MTPDAKLALERFEVHLPLLKHLVARAMTNHRAAEALPLVQAGARGLWQAAKDFGESTSERSVRFSEYAEVAVTSALLDYIHVGPPADRPRAPRSEQASEQVPDQAPEQASERVMDLPAELAAFAGRLEAMAAQLRDEYPPQALAPRAEAAGALARRPNVPPPPGLALVEEEFPILGSADGGLLTAIGGLFKRHWAVIVGIVLVTELAVFAMVSTAPKTYKAETTLNTGIASGISASGAPIDWFKAGALMGNLTEILLSRAVLERTIQTLRLDLTPEWLAKRLEIERVSQTDLLRISATALSAEEASTLANTHVQEFMAYYASMTGRDASKTNRFVTEQAEEAERRLRQAEEKLRGFKSASLPEAQQALSEQLADTRRSRDETLQLLAAARSGLSTVEAELARLKADPEVASTVRLSPEVDAAGERLRSLHENLADARSLLGAQHPSVKELESQIAKASGQLQVATRRVAGGEAGMADVIARRIALKVELAQNQARLSAIEATLRDLEPKVKSASSEQVTLAQLQREVEIAAADYLRLRQRAGETRVAASGAATLPLTVIDPAEPPRRPESQKLPVKLALGLVVSLLFGGVVGYLLDLRRKSEPEV
jgi:uncharacterized protein involved in exopolysaccharide biosynthesis